MDEFNTYKMTMAQLLRRTKKCCAKLFQKISINESPVTKQSMTKKSTYTQQQNRLTPIHRTPRLGSSPVNTKEKYLKTKNKNYSTSNTATTTTTSSNVIRNNCDIETIYDDELTISLSDEDRNNMLMYSISKTTLKNDINMNNLKAVCSNDQNANNNGIHETSFPEHMDDNEIMFPENKMYMGSNGMQQQQQQQHEPKVIDGHSFDKRTINSGHFNFSYEIQNANCNDSKKMRKKCISKLNFEIKQQQQQQQTQHLTNPNCRLSNVYKKNQRIHPNIGVNNNMNSEILFEKVNYNKNKRYYLHSSSSNSSINSNLSNSKNIMMNENFDNFILTLNGNEDFCNGSNYKQLDQNCRIGNTRNNTPTNGAYDNLYQLQNTPNRFDTNNNSNNNAISDNMKFKNDPWEYLDNKNYVNGDVKHNKYEYYKNCKNDGIGYEYIPSSRRTSVSTIETWIEDELFDNSFNEELEKRLSPKRNGPIT